MTIQPTHPIVYRQAVIFDGTKHACKHARYGTCERVSQMPIASYLFVSTTNDSSYLTQCKLSMVNIRRKEKQTLELECNSSEFHQIHFYSNRTRGDMCQWPVRPR